MLPWARPSPWPFFFHFSFFFLLLFEPFSSFLLQAKKGELLYLSRMMLSSEEAQYQASMASTDSKGTEWLQPDNDASNTPKKKSMERISKLFQKKPKKQSTSSLTSSFSAVSLPACEYPSATNNEQQSLPPSTVHALNSNTFHTNTNTPARSSSLRIPKSQSSDETQTTSSSDSKAATPPSADGRPSVDDPTMTDEGKRRFCSSYVHISYLSLQQYKAQVQPTMNKNTSNHNNNSIYNLRWQACQEEHRFEAPTQQFVQRANHSRPRLHGSSVS